MFRRFILTAALAASTGIFALAQQGVPATLILNDGSRKTGSMGFYGEKHENLIGGYLGLDTPAGRERFKVEQVAVIDFEGGAQPNANELNALPSNGGELVLKNGQSIHGQLVAVANNNIEWRNESGQTQQHPISDVNRVYVNASAARHALNVNATNTAAVGTAGATRAMPGGAVQVNANQQWTDTGISVKAGDKVSFMTSGQINFGPNSGMQNVGADGSGNPAGPGFPIPQMAVGGLIGKVGNSAPFPIGSNTQPITMPSNGRLFLGVNDNQLGDNSGAFSVVVTKR